MENSPAENTADQPAPIRRTAADRRHSPSRERVLREIERHGSASITELHDWTGLHENTLRGHLQRLVEDGHLRQESEPAHGRGRPGHRWHAVPADSLGPYAGLAVALADALGTAEGSTSSRAREAGRSWGADIAADADDDDARALVLRTMREQGFAPAEAGADEPIVLRRCPLLSAAHRSDAVCTVHEGLIEGMLRARDAGATARLEPFAADGGCVLHLRAAS